MVRASFCGSIQPMMNFSDTSVEETRRSRPHEFDADPAVIKVVLVRSLEVTFSSTTQRSCCAIMALRLARSSSQAIGLTRIKNLPRTRASRIKDPTVGTLSQCYDATTRPLDFFKEIAAQR
jgi:hypothetical protein